MTGEKAIDLLDNLIGMVDDNHDSDYDTALKMAIKAIKKVEYLTDRPCGVCKAHSENGCSKWECVFER